ncbi:MAG: glycosyltransferase family 1 protein [Sphingobacteriaceae bacterium]|nr:glycosyltransferase family 1 protein [Sphingobacteriaceae bacterium]
MINAINIISFDVPFPANYGGVIDVFYKIKEFKKQGIKVHLHCFEYGRAQSKELEALCEKVYYYKRQTGFMSNFSGLPYNVKSRISAELTKNLLSNDYPILFEVLHTCYLLSDPRLLKRLKVYRHSNIEHDYYKHLAKSEKKLLKKIYLKLEAGKLRSFENVITHADLILAVNECDVSYFKDKYPKVKTEFLPSFHANNSVTIKEGKGDYILYNGNLSISENYAAVIWLINNVFNKLNHKIKIAGLNPPEFLISEVKKHKHIELVANPDDKTMNDLIENAHIHVLYTEQATGLKLKLVNVLHTGRFVICNDKMIEGTGLKANDGLVICNSSQDFISQTESIMKKDFTSQLITERKSQLDKFSNQKNMEKLLGLL